MKGIGDTNLFSGEDEDAIVMVKGYDLGGLNYGTPRILITQGEQSVMLSAETMEKILSWYMKE